MHLESLKSKKFSVLEKAQLNLLFGGYYSDSNDYWDINGKPVKDRREYFLDVNGNRKYTGCVEFLHPEGRWVLENDYPWPKG